MAEAAVRDLRARWNNLVPACSKPQPRAPGELAGRAQHGSPGSPAAVPPRGGAGNGICRLLLHTGKVGSEGDQKAWWQVLVQVPAEGWGSPSQTACLAENPAGERCLGLQGECQQLQGECWAKNCCPGARGAPDCTQPSPALRCREPLDHRRRSKASHQIWGDTRLTPDPPHPGKAGFEKRRNWQHAI